MKPIYSLSFLFIFSVIVFGFMAARIQNQGYEKAINENNIVIKDSSEKYYSSLIIENRNSVSPYEEVK